MNQSRFFRGMRNITMFTIFVLLMASCSSGDSNEQGTKRVRRSELESSTTDKKTTLPPLSSTTAPLNQDTTPIVELPLLTPEQLSAKWTKNTLCGLVPPVVAQEILDMSTQPVATYTFNIVSGARCSYTSGAGDEMYFEISVTSFTDARSVDVALNAEGKPAVIQGVGGVIKTNNAIGTTYELNYSGANSNQWVVNAPKDSQAKNLATAMIKSLS